MKELTIQHIAGTDEYKPRIRVAYRPRIGQRAQVREIGFDFTWTREERSLIQWYLEEYLVFPWATRRASKAEALISQKGQELFDAVFGHKETSSIFKKVANDLSHTRIIIHASDNSGISIPWELMRNYRSAPLGELARVAFAFVRSQPDFPSDLPLTVSAESALNILLIISRPKDTEYVPFQSVARPLLERCDSYRGRIRVDVLRPPTFEQLTQVLNERPNFYRVLHFDGHGAFPKETRSKPHQELLNIQSELIFEREDGSARPVKGTELGDLLTGKGVAVAVLNACQSGMAHPEFIYPSVGSQLLKAGVSGVVAMAYSIYVKSAVQFVTRLYEALIDGEELSRAVALGREEMYAHPARSSPIGDIPLQDWVVPVLLATAPVRLTNKRRKSARLPKPQDSCLWGSAEIDCPKPPEYGFLGCDDVILTLERVFRRETVVLLEGETGVGKTELALGFARWQAKTGALNGQILFSSFERRTAVEHLYDQIERLFRADIYTQIGPNWRQMTRKEFQQAVVIILREKPCLLIWDNFETVAGYPRGAPSDWTTDERQAIFEFLDELRGGLTKVIITSRCDEAWLGYICHRIEITGLLLKTAQELATRVLVHAKLAQQTITHLPEYNTLLEYLAGNPLLIQAILPELSRKKPADLLLDLRAGDIAFQDNDLVSEHEHSLKASLSYSVDRLEITVRQRLGVLALFQGFVDCYVLEDICSQEGAPAILCGLRQQDWIAVLDVAVGVGLLRGAGEGYYTIHPAMPWLLHSTQFEAFSEHLEWLNKAHLIAFAWHADFLTQAVKKNAPYALSLFDADRENLAYALRLAYKQEEWEYAGQIYYGLGYFLKHQEHLVVLERLVIDAETQIYDTAGQVRPGRDHLRIYALWDRERLANRRHDLSSQRRILLCLKDEFERMGEKINVAMALHQLGNVALAERDLDAAEEWFIQSLTVKEREGHELGQAKTLHQLGMVAVERRQWDKAKEFYHKSLDFGKRNKNLFGEISSLSELGRVATELRQDEEANKFLLSALKLARKLKHDYSQVIILDQLGTLAAECGQFDEAEEYYRKSLKFNERIRNEFRRAITFEHLGDLAFDRRHLDEAEDWYRQSLAIEEQQGNGRGQAVSLHQLGRVAEERHNFEDATELFRRAEGIMLKQNDPDNLQLIRDSLRRVCQQRPI